MRLPYYLQLQACGHAAVAVFTISLPLWAPVDQFGFNFVLGFTALLLVIAYRDYRKARTAPATERPFLPPADSTPQQQIGFYTGYLGLTLLAFPVLSVITLFQLNSLAHGTSDDTEEVWAPVAWAYDWGGYWPAALCVPVAGVIIAGIFVWRIRQLRALEAQPRHQLPIVKK